MSPAPDFDSSLALGIGFDTVDLKANEQGELSPGQLERLRAEYVRMASQSATMGSVALGFLAFVAAVVAVYAAANEALGACAVLVVVGVVLLAALFHARRTQRNPPLLKLETAEGVVRLREVDDSYRVEVAGLTFFVFPSVFEALQDGRPYRIHYVHFRFVHWRRPISALRL